MNIVRAAALLIVVTLVSGCVAFGLANVTTPTGIKAKLQGKHSAEEIEREIATWETFGVTLSEEEAKDSYSVFDDHPEYPRWPSRQEWLALKVKMQPSDQLWYFYGPVHGWCIRRDGHYIEFLILKEFPERKRANKRTTDNFGASPLRV